MPTSTRALEAAAAGTEIPFATVAGGRVVGSTRFLALRPEHGSRRDRLDVARPVRLGAPA